MAEPVTTPNVPANTPDVPVKEPNTFEDQLVTALRTNPFLAKDPQTLHAIASASGADAHGLATVTNYNALVGGVKESLGDEANASQNSSNWWQDTTSFASHLVDGTGQLVGSVDNALSRTATSAVEVGTLGAVRLRGLDHLPSVALNFSDAASNLRDARATVNNILYNVPTPDNNFGLDQAKQMIAYWESYSAKHGVAATLGELTPMLIASAFGGEALAGADAVAIDATNLTRIAARIDRGEATANDLTRLQSIQARTARRESSQQAEAAAKAADEARFASGSNLFRAGAKVFENPVRWTVGSVAKGLKGVDAFNRSLRMQALYQITNGAIQSDPATKALWEQTADGHPVDAFGRKMTISAGEGFAQVLGLQSGSLPYNIVGRGVDVGAMFSSDPITAGLGLKAKAQTAEGLGGLLGTWWKGLGVENGADVARVAGTTAQSARFINFIAKSDAPTIRKALRTDLVGPNKVIDGFVSRLAGAKTFDEVVNVFADVADGQYLTRNVMPTRGVFRDVASVVTKAIRSSLSFPEKLAAKEGVDMSTRSAFEAAVKNFSQKIGDWALRKSAKNFTEAPWFVEGNLEKAGIPNIKNYSFRMGDKNAIPAIQSMMRMSGEFSEMSIQAMGDALDKTSNPQDFANTVHNFTATMLTQAVAKSVGSPIYRSIRVELQQTIQEIVRRLYDAGGGGNPGIYVNGEFGEAYSQKLMAEDNQVGGFFGHGDTHISQAKFIDPRELAGVVKKMSAVARSLSPQIIGDGNRLRYLDEEAFSKMANFRNARLSNVVGKLKESAGRAMTSYTGARYESEMIQGYNNGVKIYENVIGMYRTMPGYLPTERFVMTCRDIFKKTDEVENALSLLSSTPFAKPQKVAELQQTLRALNDAENHLFVQVKSLSVTNQDFKDWANEFALNLDEKKILSERVKGTIASNLEAKVRANGSYLNLGNHVVDIANRLLSHTLIPLMLSTGGYIERIATAEVIPNLLRFGSTDFIEASLSRSIAKRMAGYAPLQYGVVKVGDSTLKVREANVIKRFVLDTANLLHGVTGKPSDLLAGALTGAERGILKAMSPDRFYRMLDDFQTVLQLTGGHIPDVGHSSAQLFNSDSISGGMSNHVYGVDKNGNPIVSKSGVYPTSKFTKATGENIVTALASNMRKVHTDKKLREVAIELRDIIKHQGPIFNNENYQKLLEQLTESDYGRKLLLPESEVAPFAASNMLIASLNLTTGIPIKDWAKATAYDVLSIFSGASRGKWVVHTDLLDQAISGVIKDTRSLSQQYAKLDGAPKNLIDREVVKYPWATKGVREINKTMEGLFNIPGVGPVIETVGKGAKAVLNAPNILNHTILDKTFGRFLGWVSREPAFLFRAHVEMELLRDKVARGIITEDQAINKAMENSLINMAKFVHNPADRFAFEQNMRIYAPFWFAKNQAYRRAFRLFEENPQAFMEYLKYSLYSSNYVQSHTQNGQSIVSIPGSEYLSGFFSNIMFGSNGNGLKFDYAGSLSSLASVIPTGIQTGSAGIEDMLRPPAGPFVSIAEKTLGMTGLFDPTSYTKFLDATLGPIGAKTPISSDVFPSSVYRGAWSEIQAGVLGNQNIATIVQIQIKAMHSKIDDLSKTYVNEYENSKEYKSLPADQKHLYATLYADQELTKLFGSPATKTQNQQKFIDEMNASALGLYLGKLVSTFSLPVTASLQERFSKSPEFNKILKQTLPDGSPIGFSNAISEFALKYPANFIDTVSTSQSPYGAFGQTQDYLAWSQKASNLISPDGIPFLSALLVSNTGSYVPAAAQSQISMGLRKADTPQQYMDAVLTNIGNQFYYEYLMPTYYKEFGVWNGPNNPNNQISYTGQKYLTEAAKLYAQRVNPTWSANASPLNPAAPSKEHDVSAIGNLDKFMKDPSMQKQVISNGLLSKQDVRNIGEAYKIYNEYITAINATTSGTARHNLKQGLYSVMETAAAKPEASKIARLLNVLAKSPTAN
jgi:hypothetical protein